MFDTHFHLPENAENGIAEFDLETTRHLAKSAEVLTVPPEEFELSMLAAGGDFKSSEFAREYAATHDRCYYSCGVHPHQASEYLKSMEDFSIFKADPKLVAVGEIGLDYYYEESPVAEQKIVFEKFLSLALALDLPAMLHIRDKDDSFNAIDDALARLRDFAAAKGRFVIHCCTIPENRIADFLDLGAMIGVTGMITFKRADNVRNMLKRVPLDRLLLETDSPYLAPVPFRGKANTPGLLPLAAQSLAAERNLTLAELGAQTTANAERFYLNIQQERI